MPAATRNGWSVTAMQDGTLMSRIAWTLAHVGLGVFWSVVAMQQFGTAWSAAHGNVHPLEENVDVDVG